MPFQSLAQEHFLEAHPEKLKGKIGEWEAATKGKKLPKRKKKPSEVARGMRGR
jgi:hypothetical protein